MRDRIRAIGALTAPPAPDMDDALRRARRDEITRVLTRAAAYLADTNPDEPMDDAARMAALMNGASGDRGYNHAALRLETIARPYAPALTPGATRGEYAVCLRLAAREVRL